MFAKKNKMIETGKTAAHACGSTRYVTRADLVRSAAMLGAAYTFNDSAPADERVLHGQFDTLRLRPGLILHAACVQDLRTMATSNQLDPGVKIVLLVDGATDLSFGHHRFQLGPCGADPAQRGGGALVNLAEEDLFSRRWQAGRAERKVSLTLTPEWMEEGGLATHGDHGALRAFCREHLSRRPWTLSARARGLARQILEPASFLPGLERLRLEARCIELAAEALGAIGDAGPARGGLRAVDRRRLCRLEELLRAAGNAEMSMAGIARELGTNPVSLQALTRQAWGCSVFGRLRTLRLERARDALLDGASVGEAAAVAGYAAATNFATAYRKHFGTTPRQAARTRTDCEFVAMAR
ncbi:helix-turn-helix domain-containing protein [Massilia dura]|uniref:Helix-turn-helix domain-containing protein n=2 Tax=Pseudoduganella dura TaxID=321982 RepID=A0A6I3XGT5_9BURK|nr:helix-turn-helix domain-containing protein [Pseudoduganella dura]